MILGNGRYFSMRLGDPSAGLLGSLRQFGYPKLLAQLEITYKDGSKTVVVSDDSWKLTTNGPIIANNEFDGEEYNANYEKKINFYHWFARRCFLWAAVKNRRASSI